MGMLTRGSALGIAAAVVGAASALPVRAADVCQIGPAPHAEGPHVFLNYDQLELDAAYNQTVYEPWQGQYDERRAWNTDQARRRIGEPIRTSYGPTKIETLDIYRTKRPKAPIMVFIHGGAWLRSSAGECGVYAEPFVTAGAHCVIPDFTPVDQVGGDLNVMTDQVLRAVAWAYKNAASFGGDPNRLYVSGHSSGGHLCGVAVTTDWKRDYGLPPDVIKGGLCMSGMYDLYPVSLSARGKYVNLTPATIAALSPQRHIDRISAPIIVTYGTNETPEFQRQNKEFAAAVKAAGKTVDLVVASGYGHFDMEASIGSPYGPNGYAALRLMKLHAG